MDTVHVATNEPAPPPQAAEPLPPADEDSEFRGALCAAIAKATGKVPRRYVPAPPAPPLPPRWGWEAGERLADVLAGSLTFNGRVIRATDTTLDIGGSVLWRGHQVPAEFRVTHDGEARVVYTLGIDFTRLLPNRGRCELGTLPPLSQRPAFTFNGYANEFFDLGAAAQPEAAELRARSLALLTGGLQAFERDVEEARSDVRRRMRELGVVLSEMAQRVTEGFARLRDAVQEFGHSMRAAWVAARDFNRQLEAFEELRGEPFEGITFQRAFHRGGLDAEPIIELVDRERDTAGAYRLAEELQAVEYAVRDAYSGRNLTPELAEEVATLAAEMVEENFRRMANGRDIPIPRLNLAQSPPRRLHFCFTTPHGDRLPFVGELLRFLTL
jgi:hypothetical protein